MIGLANRIGLCRLGREHVSDDQDIMLEVTPDDTAGDPRNNRVVIA
jgi:hypothetical protein